MARRWDIVENEWACRDLVIAAFPQAVSRWSEEELAELHTIDLLVENSRRDPQTALEMAKLLLNTAEEHLQNEEAANQLLGWDLYDLLVSDDMLPLLVEKLEWDDRLAHQLFQSAYVDRPQEAILNACGRLASRSCNGNSWRFWTAIHILMMRSNRRRTRSDPDIFDGAYSLYRRAKN